MAGPNDVVTVPRGTVGFERKVQVRDYETATASIFIGFDIDPENEAATVQAANDAFFQAKSVVLEQLGITFEYDQEKGMVKELLTAKFGPVTEVTPSQGNTTQGPRAVASSNETLCPECNGSMYDNRATKVNPRQPDFRCKNYKDKDGGCKGVIWPAKKG